MGRLSEAAAMLLELWKNARWTKGERGKAPPICGAKEKEDIEEIEGAGNNRGGHRDQNKKET